MEALAEYGCWGLFLASFLAATILPFSSEVVLGYLLHHGVSPSATLFAATSGNILGAVVNYALGRLGSRVLLNRMLRMSEAEIEKAEERFRVYGVFSLFFSWVPIIGDPLTVAAGLLKIRFDLFLVLVGTGKFLRYAAVTWAVLAA